MIENSNDLNVKLADAQARADELLTCFATQQQPDDVKLFALQLIDFGVNFLTIAESLTKPELQS